MQHINLKQFDSKQALYASLKKHISQIPNYSEYNLYLHKVYDFDEYGKSNPNVTVEKNMMGIFKEGFRLSRYKSLNFTAVHAGDLSPFKTDTIINYDYPWKVDKQAVVIIAMPKTTVINGEQINLSTPIFYSDAGNKPMSAFDGVKFDTLPKEYVLGSIVTNLNNELEADYLNAGNKYEFYINNKHISLMDKEEQKASFDKINSALINTYKLTNQDGKDDIRQKIFTTIKNSSNSGLNFRDGSYESDFDFD